MAPRAHNDLAVVEMLFRMAKQKYIPNQFQQTFNKLQNKNTILLYVIHEYITD